jgi:hypothetical protein
MIKSNRAKQIALWVGIATMWVVGIINVFRILQYGRYEYLMFVFILIGLIYWIQLDAERRMEGF